MLDGGAFAAITTAFKFVEFCYAIGDVPEESLVFIRLIQRVRHDLDECLRLLTLPSIQNHLDCDPDQKRYINGTIQDTKGALAGIGKYVESVRTEEEWNGEISLRTRFEWILRHQYKLQSRQVGLDTCHKSLLQAMTRLTLFTHTASLTKGQIRSPSHIEAMNDKGGLARVSRVCDEIMSDDELTSFLTTRNRRTRLVRAKSASELPIDTPQPECVESLPQVTTHASFHPRRSTGTDLKSSSQPQLQLPFQQPQRNLTQAQERRETTRARLNLIAGE
ncbi:Sexual differentiation process protein isp4 [Venturia nashicola]|uniref:Sexual differentiation process protein isp4 n=1 Tax=Venturia nashicola TaxID=86259 RepID=A0A4Z1P5Q9_9PEZI|nr:Sexual differentiation process protein isp4 [Venturia nashicola]